MDMLTSEKEEIMKTLNGKTALITGASGGLGLQMARQFVKEGCVVYMADVNLEAAEREAEGLGSNASAVRMDVGDMTAVNAAIEAISRNTTLDVLVNNAGVIAQGPYDRLTPAEWDRLVKVNLTGVFNCIQAVAPFMVNQESGNIINITSVSAFKGGGTMGNVWYGTTKAAIVAMTKGLSRELGPNGVRVNGIAPSVVETDMLKDTLNENIKRKILGQFPLGRLATKSDVANMAVFLASDLSSFVTGQIIAVDGGYLNT